MLLQRSPHTGRRSISLIFINIQSICKSSFPICILTDSSSWISMLFPLLVHSVINSILILSNRIRDPYTFLTDLFGDEGKLFASHYLPVTSYKLLGTSYYLLVTSY